MLVYRSKLIGTPVLSLQTGSPIGNLSRPIVNPDNLQIIAFKLNGPLVSRRAARLLDVKSIREYSHLGLIIDDIDELVAADDVVKIAKVLELHFDLIGLKAKTKKGSRLGHIINYTVTPEDFLVQQIIVKRPAVKSFLDPELVISRKEIVEVNDYAVIIKDEEKVLKQRAEKEDFIPNFVNPFRKTELSPAPVRAENPADKDKQ